MDYFPHRFIAAAVKEELEGILRHGAIGAFFDFTYGTSKSSVDVVVLQTKCPQGVLLFRMMRKNVYRYYS